MTVGTDEWGGVAPSQHRRDVGPPPVWRLEAVVAVERPHHLRVSPDGTRVAFILDRSDVGSDVWTIDVAGGLPVQLTVDRSPIAFWEDTAPVWSPDGAHIAYAADGWVRLVSSRGGPSRPLVEGGSPVFTPGGVLIVTTDVSRSVTATILETATEVTRLALVELADPWVLPITDASSDASNPDVVTGRLAYTRHPVVDRNRSDVVVLELESGMETIVDGVDGIQADSARWSPDGIRVVYVSQKSGWYSVYVWDGADVRRLTAEEADFSQMSWSADGSTLVAVRARRGRSDLVLIDVETSKMEVLAKGGTWSDPAFLSDGSVMAVFEDAVTPARIEQVDGRRNIVFDPAPAAIRTARHIRPEEVVYESRDGLEIHGFLYRPAMATPGRPVPAVVYPHGGPTSCYGDEWDGHAQYFVDKGYAWFAINFRGSTSYGRDFERANHGTWGVDDTADCLAAADHVAKLDWVDGGRVAIFGASYGSYLALSSLTKDPQYAFACAVAKYGDSDILTSWAQSDRVGREDLERMMKHPSRALTAYRAGSPIHHVENIQRPILIAHGERDERVHPDQSTELVRELERFGKTYEYVTYPTEGHGLLRRQPQLHFYRRLERFLDWYLM